jgi:hypothetical protein
VEEDDDADANVSAAALELKLVKQRFSRGDSTESIVIHACLVRSKLYRSIPPSYLVPLSTAKLLGATDKLASWPRGNCGDGTANVGIFLIAALALETTDQFP